MKIGVVILNYNDYANTRQCVLHLRSLKLINYIVVVDNCSSDDSYEKLSHLKHEIDGWFLLRTEANKGYGYGNNRGIAFLRENTDTDIVCISNPDVEFDDDFVKCIIEDFDNNHDIGLISGIQMTPEGEISPNAFWQRKIFKGEIEFMLRSLTIVRRFVHSQKRKEFIIKALEAKKNIIDVPVLSGCLFFASIDVMYKIGYFDENTFLYYEEDILSEKMHRSGFKVCIDPRVRFLHIGGGSTKNVMDNAKMFEISCNSYLYFADHYMLKSVVERIVFHFVYAIFWIDRKTVYKMRKIMGMD